MVADGGDGIDVPPHEFSIIVWNRVQEQGLSRRVKVWNSDAWRPFARLQLRVNSVHSTNNHAISQTRVFSFRPCGIIDRRRTPRDLGTDDFHAVRHDQTSNSVCTRPLSLSCCSQCVFVGRVDLSVAQLVECTREGGGAVRDDMVAKTMKTQHVPLKDKEGKKKWRPTTFEICYLAALFTCTYVLEPPVLFKTLKTKLQTWCISEHKCELPYDFSGFWLRHSHSESGVLPPYNEDVCVAKVLRVESK